MEKINQLQLLQQNLQQVQLQKQQLQQQMAEFDSALTEAKTTDKAYKIIGKIMIAAPKDALLKDLQQKKEVAEIHFRNFTKQEESLQKNIDAVQKEVLAQMKK
ncbi:prefoldin subunit [Candidatus Woesearchaeota archaeon]|nr:prefoldin subunit [Candidatus Woesearchaeota archaeon]